jgi:hypothetical protein
MKYALIKSKSSALGNKTALLFIIFVFVFQGFFQASFSCEAAMPTWCRRQTLHLVNEKRSNIITFSCTGTCRVYEDGTFTLLGIGKGKSLTSGMKNE